MKTKQQIQKVLDIAKSNGCKTVEIDGIKFDLTQNTSVSTEVKELKAEEIINPMSILDDLSEDEILYYSTPYYDELQAKKERIGAYGDN